MARRRRCASTQLLSFPLPRILAPSSCLCRRLALSSPALLLSPLQHRLRLRLFPPLLRRLRRGSCLYCCLAYASTQLLQLFSFSCWLSPVLSSKPSHALRSASWHDFSTANLLGSSVRQLGSARLGGSSVRLSARLFLRLGLGDRPLVGAACRLGSSAHLLGPSRRLVQDRPPSSTAPPLRMIILLHRQLRTPSGCAPLRPTPSRCTKTVIRQRNTLQPRLAFDRLRAIEHRSTTIRHVLSYTSAHDARLHSYATASTSLYPTRRRRARSPIVGIVRL